MGKHLTFVGGGHAHLTALSRLRLYLDRGHRVTVINPSRYHYYSGMGPGMLSGLYRPEDIRFNIQKMVEQRGGVFIEDAVASIDAQNRTLALKSGRKQSYDAVSFNTGSFVPADDLDGNMENVFPVKPIINLVKAKEAISRVVLNKEANIVIVGGGPAGIEICCNAWGLVNGLGARANFTLLPGRRLLDGLPDRARILVRQSVESRGIILHDGVRAVSIDDHTITGSDGTAIRFDICLVATGVKPSSLFKDSGIPTGPTGGLLVNRYLQSPSYPEMFGGGDCIDFAERPLAKVGVYAVRQNPILMHNLLATLENQSLRAFIPQKRFMLIFNLGNGTGLLERGKFVWDGKTAFFLKDYIDRKFMKTFQLSGEAREE